MEDLLFFSNFKIFTNGKIYTMSKEGEYFDTMVVYDGKIVFLGNYDDLGKDYFKSNEVIDLEGKTVIPSFCDAHIHFMYSAISFNNLDLSECKTFNQFKNKIKEKYEINKSNNEKIKFIIGGGWDYNVWGDFDRSPNKKDLEEFNEIPIALYSKDYHAILLNDCAINELNLNELKKEILNELKINEKGFYENAGFLNDSNELSGLFYENSMKYIAKLLSKNIYNDKENLYYSIEKFISYLNSFGITAVTDCSSLWDDSSFKYLCSMNLSNINLRNCISITEDSIDKFIEMGLITGFGNDFIKVGCLKLMYDGSLGSGTGLMYENYSDSNTSGVRNYNEEYFEKITEKAVKNNIGLSIHAIGDKACAEVIDKFVKIREKNNDIVLRIEHAQTLDDETIEKAKEKNILFVMQPVHIDQDIPSATKKIGNRSKLLYRFKSLIEKNIYPAFSTDYPVAPINPFLGIFSAVTHKGFNFSKNLSLNIDEKISLFQAVKLYTYYSHKYSLFNKSGLLLCGYNADFIVLDKNIFEIKNEEEVLDINVEKVYLGGRKIFER